MHNDKIKLLNLTINQVLQKGAVALNQGDFKKAEQLYLSHQI